VSLYPLEDAFHLLRVVNQGLNGGGEQSFKVLELVSNDTETWAVMCCGGGWLDRLRVE
jgi:hypothetical protein